MTTAEVLTLVSVLLTSAVACIGLIALRWTEDELLDRIPVMIAVTCGVLIGEAVFHLIPESVHQGLSLQTVFGLVSAAMLVCFGLESALRLFAKDAKWKPVTKLALVAESVHNATDGAIIAVAYMAGIRIGIFATFAVLLHELPHELGNFSILVHGGCSRIQAILLNGISALAAIVGAVAIMIAGKHLGNFGVYLLPPSAGCFFYIAVFDLLPDHWGRANHAKRKALGYAATLGAGIMLLLAVPR